VRLALSRSGGDARRLRRGPIALARYMPPSAPMPSPPLSCTFSSEYGVYGARAWPLGSRSQRPHNEERGEPSVPAHRFHGPPDPPCPTRAAMGSCCQLAGSPASMSFPRPDRVRAGLWAGFSRPCEPNRPHLGAFLVQPEVRSMCLL